MGRYNRGATHFIAYVLYIYYNTYNTHISPTTSHSTIKDTALPHYQKLESRTIYRIYNFHQPLIL